MEPNVLHKLLLSEIEKLALKLDKHERNIANVDKELFKVNQHLDVYNEQLKLHIKRSELSEERLDVAEHQVEQMLQSVESIKDMITRFDNMYNDFKQEQSRKNFILEMEKKRKDKLDSFFQKSRIAATILGIPLAMFGLIEGVKMIIELIGR